MELIILFVLFMILSSIVRAFSQGRSQQKRAGPQAPPAVEKTRPAQHPVSKARRPVPDGMVGAEDTDAYRRRDEKSRDRKGTASKSTRQEAEVFQKTASVEEIGRAAQKTPKKGRTSSRLDGVTDPKQELDKLLGSPNITMGFVVSEVLSAPRARRPYKKGIR